MLRNIINDLFLPLVEIIAFISIHLNKEIYEEVLIQEKNNQKLLKYINNSNIDNIKKLVQNSGLLDKIYIKKIWHFKSYNYTFLQSVEQWLIQMSQSILTNMLDKILGAAKFDFDRAKTWTITEKNILINQDEFN